MSDLSSRLASLSADQRSALLGRLADLRPAPGGRPGEDDAAVGQPGPVPLLPAQRLLLGQLDTHRVDPGRYNITSLVAADCALRSDLAGQALGHALAGQDALRLRLSRSPEGWRQEVSEAGPEPPSVIDLGEFPAEDGGEELRRAAQDLSARIDLAVGPVAQLAVARAGGRSLIMLVLSHLVADGYSAGLLLGDLWACYQQLSQGRPVRLPKPATTFREWATLLHGYAGSPEFNEDSRYWREFPWDRVTSLPAAAPGSGALTTVEAALTAAETAALLGALPTGTQLPEAVLAALVLVLGRWTGGSALGVSLVRHGRAPVFPGVDLSRTAGWLTVHPTVLIDLADVAGLAQATVVTADQVRRVPRDGITFEWLRYRMEPSERVQWADRLRQAHLTFNYRGGAESFPAGLRSATDEADGSFSGPHIWPGRSLFTGVRLAAGRLRVNFGFDEQAYRPDTVRAIADELGALLRRPDDGRTRASTAK